MTRFYITTAIDYVNSRPHLGRVYEKVCADVIARYKRLSGVDTFFLMGNDEHSQNVYKSATEQGLDPLALLRSDGGDIPEDVAERSICRTTISSGRPQPRHKAAVTELVQRIYDAGDIYEGVYEGWYCVGCEAFKPEKELVNGRCPVHPQTEPQWIKEKNYFFRLSKYQKPLLEHFQNNPDFSSPICAATKQLRLARELDSTTSPSAGRGQAWGIPLPWDAEQRCLRLVRRADQLRSRGRPGNRPPSDSEHWWPADLHLIGKDITRFHTVIWPAMLMSAGLPLPRAVFAHGFMSVNDQRMSKSNPATIIDPLDAAKRHGVDPLRFSLREGSRFRRRRRFLVGAVRRALQRRSREQSRQPRQPRDCDGASVSREGRLVPRAKAPRGYGSVANDISPAYRRCDGQARVLRCAACGDLPIDRSRRTCTSRKRRHGRLRRIRHRPID